MIGLQDGAGALAKKKKAERVFPLHLTVLGTEPRVGRVLLVRESMWLSRLHDSIQVAFDWFDYQTHVFNFEDLRFGNPLKRQEVLIEDDRDISLADLDLENRASFTYGYNFSEGWVVDIRVDKPIAMEKGLRYPHCVSGERAGPPEDCGGIEAFHDMLACLREPETELGREWREWIGPDYNPDVCNLTKINQALRRLTK
jgi:hypothetical protein